MEGQDNLFKCPNDLKVTIVKDNGEVVVDESCCTNLSILVKNSGEIATSFLGAHSPEMIKVLERSLKVYFKSIKKTLRAEYKREGNEEIMVVKGDSDTNSKEIDEALSKEVEVDIKYEFESLKDIEKAVNKVSGGETKPKRNKVTRATTEKKKNTPKKKVNLK